jgi:hypothetical protein
MAQSNVCPDRPPDGVIADRELLSMGWQARHCQLQFKHDTSLVYSSGVL